MLIIHLSVTSSQRQVPGDHMGQITHTLGSKALKSFTVSSVDWPLATVCPDQRLVQSHFSRKGRSSLIIFFRQLCIVFDTPPKLKWQLKISFDVKLKIGFSYVKTHFSILHSEWLLTHRDVLTSCIGHLENTGSLNNADFSNTDTLYSTISRKKITFFNMTTDLMVFK